jgi:phenylacetate-coenzyme A ligase PaaK-like adenylate-forming protein
MKKSTAFPIDKRGYGRGECSWHGKYEGVGFMGCPECFRSNRPVDIIYTERVDPKTNKIMKIGRKHAK